MCCLLVLLVTPIPNSSVSGQGQRRTEEICRFLILCAPVHMYIVALMLFFIKLNNVTFIIFHRTKLLIFGIVSTFFPQFASAGKKGISGSEA